MWHDNETTVDYLNFGVVADACAKLLQQAQGIPISIGVSGGWGVGKSSLVRMVASMPTRAKSRCESRTLQGGELPAFESVRKGGVLDVTLRAV